MSSQREPYPKFSLGYSKIKSFDVSFLVANATTEPICETVPEPYNPFHITQLQHYNPIYNELFEITENNYNKIALNQQYQFVNMNVVEENASKNPVSKPVFIKYSPLVDPVHYVVGKYKTDKPFALPTPFNIGSDAPCMNKICTPHNAAYIDNFFYYLSSQLLHHNFFVHGIDFYGSFMGIQKHFMLDIVDDLEYLHSSTYFRNIRDDKIFLRDTHLINMFENESRKNRVKLHISRTNQHNFTVENLDQDITDINDISASDLEPVYQQDCSSDNIMVLANNANDESDDSTVNSEVSNSTDESGIDTVHFSDDDDDDTCSTSTCTSVGSLYAFIKDFPILATCIEKCDGTIDKLFDKQEIDCEQGIAAMMQVIMILITYQKAFRFTHNDLHTNNIMYTNTNKSYLYYRYKKQLYKVPTFGRIYKLIDFGRSIYTFNGRIFCSDSFAPGGDASTQYNTEPFFDHDNKRIDPNYSFDLCRLGCSLFDFIMEDASFFNADHLDELQRTVCRWCSDDNGKNILYKRSGDERYPGFKLYKMIARTVHRHSPDEQLKHSTFSRFEMSNKIASKKNIKILDIDLIPVYA